MLNTQAMGKTLVPKYICCSFISFPPFEFEHFDRYRSFAGHVTNISTMNMSHIVKATELKLFAKFYDD